MPSAGGRAPADAWPQPEGASTPRRLVQHGRLPAAVAGAQDALGVLGTSAQASVAEWFLEERVSSLLVPSSSKAGAGQAGHVSPLRVVLRE